MACAARFAFFFDVGPSGRVAANLTSALKRKKIAEAEILHAPMVVTKSDVTGKYFPDHVRSAQ
jgi:hypothetical protein